MDKILPKSECRFYLDGMTLIAQNYKFLQEITHFCTELQNNYTALSQSESSIFLCI